MPKTIYRGKCACSHELNCMSVPPAQSKRILMVGMYLLNVVNLCERYPQEDTDSSGVTGYWQRGGNASNASTVLRHLGVSVEFLGVVSSLPGFAFLLEDFKRRGIITDKCPPVPNDPGISSVILSLESGSRTVVESNRNFPVLKFDHFSPLDLNEYKWINFEARNCADTVQMIKQVHQYNSKNPHYPITISLDVEIPDAENVKLCELVHYIVLSKGYANFMGWQGGPKEAAMGLRKSMKPQPELNGKKPIIIVPFGAEGAAYLDENDNYEILPSCPPAKVVDTLGAGDTFLAGLVYGLAVKDLSLRNSITMGNRCAGYKIGYQGFDCMADFKNILESEK